MNTNIISFVLGSALSTVFLLNRTNEWFHPCSSNEIVVAPQSSISITPNNEHENNAFASAFHITALKHSEQLFPQGVTHGEVPRRPLFDLSSWDKKNTGGLKDLDRVKLADIYRNATSVFEWGLGESSFIAAKVEVPRYVGIDSDPIWIQTARDQSPNHFRFHLGDIGPTGSWGRPLQSRLPKAYLNYQFEPLLAEKSFDVYYVDGRMRLACALVAFLHASARGTSEEEKSPIVIIHDYYHPIHSQKCKECRDFKWQRLYHRLEEVADLVDHSGAMLAAFKRKNDVTDDMISRLWEEVAFLDT